MRTWYNFNQFRFRKEILYFLIPRSLQLASPPPGRCPGPAGPQAPRQEVRPPNVKSWIRGLKIHVLYSCFEYKYKLSTPKKIKPFKKITKVNDIIHLTFKYKYIYISMHSEY